MLNYLRKNEEIEKKIKKIKRIKKKKKTDKKNYNKDERTIK